MKSMHVFARVTATFLLAALVFGIFSRAADAAPPSGISPSALTVGPNGRIYYSDCSAESVDAIDPATGQIAVIAGNGLAGYSGDGGSALLARLGCPQGLAIDFRW